MLAPRFPRYATHNPTAGWSPDLDWSRIDQRRGARDRADRICGRLMYLVLPTLVAALLVFACAHAAGPVGSAFRVHFHDGTSMDSLVAEARARKERPRPLR